MSYRLNGQNIMKTAEEILENFLDKYPWQYEAKANALKAMREYALQAFKAARFYDDNPNYDLVEASLNENYKVVRYVFTLPEFTDYEQSIKPDLICPECGFSTKYELFYLDDPICSNCYCKLESIFK